MRDPAITRAANAPRAGYLKAGSAVVHFGTWARIQEKAMLTLTR